MIKRILTYYASRLDEYLRHKFPQPEGVAEVGFIGNCADEAIKNLYDTSEFLLGQELIGKEIEKETVDAHVSDIVKNIGD